MSKVALWMVAVVVVCGCVQTCVGPPAPPVHRAAGEAEDSGVKEDLAEYMEYHRYLREVVGALESDPEFRARLEAARDEDVRSGRIAEQLDFVSHGVRTKLDEAKRRELERLRHLAAAARDPAAAPDHLDHGNPHTFEVEDLKRLIKQTTADLDAADKQRKEQFKEYEMEKEFEKKQKLEKLDEEHKKEFQKKLEAEEQAKKHHKPLHHPGSKQQLEEVWEKQDHMDEQFNPKAFFMMHDVDGNGVWDADEVKALFVKELDKMYGPGAPNQDKRERAEEMERMREHVFSEADVNRDGLIDFEEFMRETKKSNFNKDPDWKPIDDNQIYSQSEYQEFERRRIEEIKYLQQLGLVDSYGRPIPGAEHQVYAAQQAYHQRQQQAYYQQQQQAYPQGVPQGHAYPQGQGYPQGVPQGHGYPQGVPQDQAYPQQQHPYQGQAPQQQPYQGQAPQQQPYQGQAPQQQPYQGQAPPQHAPVPPQPQQAQAPPHQQQQGQVAPQQGQVPPHHEYQGQSPPQQNPVPVQQNQLPLQQEHPHPIQAGSNEANQTPPPPPQVIAAAANSKQQG